MCSGTAAVSCEYAKTTKFQNIHFYTFIFYTTTLLKTIILCKLQFELNKKNLYIPFLSSTLTSKVNDCNFGYTGGKGKFRLHVASYLKYFFLFVLIETLDAVLKQKVSFKKFN